MRLEMFQKPILKKMGEIFQLFPPIFGVEFPRKNMCNSSHLVNHLGSPKLIGDLGIHATAKPNHGKHTCPTCPTTVTSHMFQRLRYILTSFDSAAPPVKKSIKKKTPCMKQVNISAMVTYTHIKTQILPANNSSLRLSLNRQRNMEMALRLKVLAANAWTVIRLSKSR